MRAKPIAESSSPPYVDRWCTSATGAPSTVVRPSTIPWRVRITCRRTTCGGAWPPAEGSAVSSCT
jgi:hypothetical protein